MGLRIVQHFFGGASLFLQFANTAGCKTRGRALFARDDRSGKVLCGAHEREAKESGEITTCGDRQLGDRGEPNGYICTLKTGHNGDLHQYHVDGTLSRQWKVG